MRKMSRKMALCGVLAAVAAVLLMLGGIVPLATFCCPILAMLTMVPIEEEYRTGTALVFYAAVAILGLLLSPDKECALVFVFFGYYPAIREKINRIHRAKLLRVPVKFCFFLLSVVALYLTAIFVFSLAELAAEFRTTATLLLLAELVVGGAVFLLCDVLLGRFSVLYRQRLRPKLFRGQ